MSETDKMVTAVMSGGLGNQLFEIATTMAYAWDHGRQYFFRYTKEYLLDRRRPAYWDNILKNVGTHRYDIAVHKLYQEPSYQYAPLSDFEEDTVSLKGYFQSYRHFHHYRARLLALLDHTLPVVTAGTCSIHFRLEDYKNHPEFYPILNVNYYAQGIYKIMCTHKITNVMYFADPASLDEAREMVTKLQHLFPHLVFVHSAEVSGPLADHEEMLLMAACDYHVIANSTFSWWGAYLGKSQMVCYPKLWLYKFDTSHIAPPEWHVIDWK